jgi:hypothetical protein
MTMRTRLTEVARVLDGEVSGRDSVLCPAPGHSRRDRSLSVRFDPAAPEGFLVYPFAGDDIITCRDHVRHALGLQARGGRSTMSGRSPNLDSVEPRTAPNAKREHAQRLWSETRLAADSPVETYLGSRGLTLPPPTALRFHPHLVHPTGTSWPGMVALVRRGTDGEPLGIHRTFLAQDGSAKAPVEPNKMMLGSCRGGAVRLAKAGDVLLVGEGIETCLSAMQATGRPAWAALSTSGLRTLDLPELVTDVIVLADGDDAGEGAARHAATRWRKEGRRVRIARPPRGMDFNDMLLRREGAR